MFGKVLGRGAGRREADPYAMPVPRNRKKGTHRVNALGDTRVLALREAARAGDWEAFTTASAAFDLGREHRVLGELADLGGVQNWILPAAEEDPEHRATALLVAGARNIVWGWEARTGAWAKDVSRTQWKLFHERLEVAEEQLLGAAELRPGWVTPWRELLVSGMGMSVGRTVNEVRLEAALRRDPLDLESHVSWVSYLQPRWSGEPGEALAFARGAFAKAPQGARLGCVLAYAHIEEWVEADRGDELDKAPVRDELTAAAEHSILHPGYERRPGWQYEFNAFAMALSLAGARKTARRVFAELDGACTERPWNYFAEPEKQFARFRGRA
jgi:hypothetical protein